MNILLRTEAQKVSSNIIHTLNENIKDEMKKVALKESDRTMKQPEDCDKPIIEENEPTENDLSNEPTDRDFSHDRDEVKSSKMKEIEDKIADLYDILADNQIDSEEAEEIKKGLEILEDRLNREDTPIEESEDFDFLNKDAEFRYQLLDRMKGDCKYYLGNGNRQNKYLWAGNVDDQIEDMKKLYNSFPDDKKPEWITMEDINNFEKEMKKEKPANESAFDKLENKVAKGCEKKKECLQKKQKK